MRPQVDQRCFGGENQSLMTGSTSVIPVEQIEPRVLLVRGQRVILSLVVACWNKGTGGLEVFQYKAYS